MDKIDLKISAYVIALVSVAALFYDPLLALSLILGFAGFNGYYLFLQMRIDSLLKKRNKFVFYLSIVLSMLLMAMPFAIITLIAPSALNYAGCAIGFIIFKIVLDIKGFLKK